MYSFDLSLIAASAVATVVVVLQWSRLGEMQARASALLVLAGIWVGSSIYVADLFAMTLFQYFRGPENENRFMVDVHTIYAWYANAFSTFLITISLVVFTRRFVIHTKHLEVLAEKLSDQKKQLDQASSLAKLGYCVFNTQSGDIEYCSDTHANNFCQTKEDYINEVSTPNSNLLFIHPHDRERVQQKYLDLRAGKSVVLEYRVSSRGGERLIREVTQPIIDKNGNVVREMMSSLDITQKHQTETELKITRQRLDAAITGASIGVFDVDIQNGVSTVSSTWRTLMGFEPGEDVNAQAEWLARVHPEDLPSVQKADVDCIAGKTARSEAEYRLRVADGTWRWMRSVAIPQDFTRGNTPQRLVGVQIDITKLKETDLIKREFVSTVSHELRTPLSSIHGALKLLLGKVSGDLPLEAVDLLKIAQRNSDRLVLLINDILDVEKLAAQKGVDFNILRSNIGDLVEKTIESVQPLSIASGITVDVRDLSQDSAAFVDADRFEQVLVNLVSNAIKFSPKNGLVRVKIERISTLMRVSVTDQGPGISPEFSGKVFERFSKASSSDAKFSQGAGLGLFISKQLVEQMGGQIGFRSEPNMATTFWIEFPTDANEPLVGATEVAA